MLIEKSLSDESGDSVHPGKVHHIGDLANSADPRNQPFAASSFFATEAPQGTGTDSHFKGIDSAILDYKLLLLLAHVEPHVRPRDFGQQGS